MIRYSIAADLLERWAEAIASALVELDAVTSEYADYVPSGDLFEVLEQAQQEIREYLASGGR